MSDDVWSQLRYFSRDENWGDPDRMDPDFLILLDTFRGSVGCPFVLSTAAYATQGHLTHSFHYEGKAADGRFVRSDDGKPLSLSEHILIALRSPFHGVGIYTWSPNGPFVHFDNRPLISGERKIWFCEKENVYQNLSAEFLKTHL